MVLSAMEGVLDIRLLGEPLVLLAGRPLSLPPSKKTRALLSYLALTGRAHRREKLCALLWDVTDDPRAALRWSLSKLRELVDSAQDKRLLADRESVQLDARKLRVDALEAKQLLRGVVEDLPTATLEAAVGMRVSGEVRRALAATVDDEHGRGGMRRGEVRRGGVGDVVSDEAHAVGLEAGQRRREEARGATDEQRA